MILISWSRKLIFHSDNNLTPRGKNRGGFTLLEVMTALTILVAIVAAALTGMNKCLTAMADIESKTKAFKTARENMESLLGRTSVTEMVDFGSLEENPDIEWELSVEPFTEPVTAEMWIKATSTASYTATDGERKYVELTHWLTNLTDAQVKKIREQRELEMEFLNERIVNPYGEDAEGLMMFQEYLAKEGRYMQAAETALDLIRNYPDSPEAQSAIANANGYNRKLAENGEFTFAADMSMAMASLMPGTEIETQSIDEAVKIAKQAANAGDYRSAVEISEQLEEKYPDNSNVQRTAGLVPAWIPRAETQPPGKVIPPSSSGSDTGTNTGNNSGNSNGNRDTGNDSGNNSGSNNQSSGNDPISRFERGEITIQELIQILLSQRGK